ncbi:UNVERIFIED_CONTAM: hypothetical protein GTU68_045069 [Idotea baltica]|nr:hypothetical protein [Idotea baltica]
MPEPRCAWENYRCPLNEIIVVALCATIANCETWDEIGDSGNEHREWLEQYLELQHGIPSHDTIARVISSLDTAKF